MNDTPTSSFAWWRARRLRYNIALIIAGLLAFVAYVAVVSLLLPDNSGVEFTLPETLIQGTAYLFMIVLANFLYFLGPLSERVVRPRDADRYRRICYRLGFWFSAALPFGVPVLLVIEALFYPGYLNQALNH